MKPSRVGGPTPKTHLFRGRYMTAKEIAAITGKHVNLIHQRIRQGRPLDVDGKPGTKPKTYLHDGRRLTINAIAERTGMSRYQIVRRISGDRVMGEQELAAMPRERGKNEHLVFYNGQRLNISEWSRKLGKNKNTLIRRLHVGWPVHLALTAPVIQPREVRMRNREMIRRIVACNQLHQIITASGPSVDHDEPYPGGIRQLPPYHRGPAGGPSRNIPK